MQPREFESPTLRSALIANLDRDILGLLLMRAQKLGTQKAVPRNRLSFFVGATIQQVSPELRVRRAR